MNIPSLIFKNLNKGKSQTIFHLYHLTHFLTNSPGNTGNRWNSNHFSDDIQKFYDMTTDDFSSYIYGILSFLPEYWFNILHSFFNLPSLTTCVQKRKNLIKKNISLNNLCSIDDKAILEKYITYYWGNIQDLPDKRVLLVIDAAALSVNIGVNQKTQKTIGFIDETTIESNQNFEEFLDDRYKKQKIAKDVFVILLCPLDPKLKPLVIYRKYSPKGNATRSEEAILLDKKSQLQEIGFQYIGTASDGDLYFYHYSREFADELISKHNAYLSMPLCQMMQEYKKTQWFQDVLHLLKTDRYSLIKGQKIRVLSSSNKLTVPYEQFASIYSSLQTNLLNDSAATKMVDSYVFDLFKWSIVKEAMINNPLLIPILLPPALLLQIFYNKKLNKDLRYHYLNIGAAFIFIQYASLFLTPCDPVEDEVYPINIQVLAKYLLLAASLAPLFLDSRSFDLADCTSHLLEHFFGLIRRFNLGNNSKEKFEFSLQKAICLQDWVPKLKLKAPIPGRHGQDSAAIVEEGDLSPEYSNKIFGDYVRAVYEFFNTQFQNHNIDFETIFNHELLSLNNYDSNGIDLNIESFEIEDKKPARHTTRQEGIICSSGLINSRQHCEPNQENQIKRKMQK